MTSVEKAINHAVEVSYITGCHDAYKNAAESFDKLLPAEVQRLCRDMAESYAAQMESMGATKQ